MADVTQILRAIEQGDPRAAEQLLPLVYDELRRLAAQPRCDCAGEEHQVKRPGRSRRQADPSPAQAKPRRSVCAPKAMAFSFYRRPSP
jgi:hypothetical protein